MPNRNYRRKGYQKRNVFSRPRGQYRAPARRGAARPQNWGSEGDIKISIGRARVWIFNNTSDVITLRPGEHIVLKIVSEYEDRLGYVYRAVVVNKGSGEDNGGDVDFKPQDWV